MPIDIAHEKSLLGIGMSTTSQCSVNYRGNVGNVFSEVAFPRVSKTIELTKLWTSQFAFPSKVAYDKVSSVLAMTVFSLHQPFIEQGVSKGKPASGCVSPNIYKKLAMIAVSALPY